MKEDFLNEYIDRYENGTIRGHVKNYKRHDDIKWYDDIGNIIAHDVRHNYKVYTTLHVSCKNNKVHEYYLQIGWFVKFYIIQRDQDKFFINTPFINQIRHIQRRFRSKLYRPILNILCGTLDIDGIVQIILSYHTKN